MPATAESQVVVSGDASGWTRAVREIAQRVLRRERRAARLSITFVGKDAMRRLNGEHLGHDRSTDVMSFSLPQPDGTVAADIYICRYVAAKNARQHAVPIREELMRLVVHGTLHALGWDHPASSRRTASPMWRRQERYLSTAR